jgi:hypothetical protein
MAAEIAPEQVPLLPPTISLLGLGLRVVRLRGDWWTPSWVECGKLCVGPSPEWPEIPGVDGSMDSSLANRLKAILTQGNSRHETPPVTNACLFAHIMHCSALRMYSNSSASSFER